ncbi:hypothetical protein [uncultured Thiodictyon sp.]|uniref:alpha/beta hydrolase family protein n=1 Tax=uncultured Thiodictyon sp. TaxID=1846217 RepID=UPI0025CCF486|nr:hypothetical protein [uncultured Thiodictyon sp.]
MRAFYFTHLTVWRGGPRPVAGLVGALALFAVACAVADAAADPSSPSQSAAPGDVLFPVRSVALTLPSGDLADVYLPGIAAAEQRVSENRFPVVAVLQGAMVDKSHYQQLGNAIARQGFVVVIPNHFRTVPSFPSPVLFSEVGVVTDVYAAVVAADAAAQSPLYGLIDTATMGLIGHSLGGSVGLYAIGGVCAPGICTDPSLHYTRPAALRAAATYGASLFGTNGTVTDVDTAGVAVALLQGSQDRVALPEKAAPAYAALERPRALIEIAGANHYGICDENNPPGARPDPGAPTLTQVQANAAVDDWIGRWLRAALRHDERAQRAIQGVSASPDGVVKVVSD